MTYDRMLTWEEVRKKMNRHLSPDDLPDPEEETDRRLYMKALTEALAEIEGRQLGRTRLEFLLAAVLANLVNVHTTRGSIALQTFLGSLWEPNGVAQYLDWIDGMMDEAEASFGFEAE